MFAGLGVAGCLACDSGATKLVVAAPPEPASPSAAAHAQVSPSGSGSEGQAACRFLRLQLWTAGRTEWLGGCHRGFAEGGGVIVNVVAGAQPERFYGQLDAGSPSVGVLHTAGGFMAGRWHGGVLVAALPDDMAQRNVLIEAFRVAADAAAATSKSFADKGNAEASSFYATQARLLRDQMD